MYCYTARTSEGRFVRGRLDAQSEPEALSVLRARKLFVSSLEVSESLRGTLLQLIPAARAHGKSVAVLFRSLATLVRAGVPVARSLTICIEQSSSAAVRHPLTEVLRDIEGGAPLSEALRRHEMEFSSRIVASVAAGERSGALDVVLDRLAGSLERERGLRKRLITALIYPSIVLCACAGVMTLLATTTIPVFQTMYAQLHVNVPPVVNALMEFGAAAKSPGHWTLPGLIAGAAAIIFLRYRRSPVPAAVIESAALAAPIAGGIVKKARLAQVARTLSDLLHAGISLHDALAVAADAATGPRLRASLLEIRDALAQGSTLSGQMARSERFDGLFVQLVRVGEESGSLDTMLQHIANHYEADVESALAALGAALEPLLILFLGGVVAAVAAAVFLPLYSLIGSIK